MTMSTTEHAELVTIARDNLDGGYWQGFSSPNGGYQDGPAWSDYERAWRAAASDFMARVSRGEPWLTEGMIAYATHDLAKELAWVRGWCRRGN
jgi:hypothetical protein